MENITISLISNKIVFSGDFPQKNEIIQEWNFPSNTIDKNNIENLYNILMYDKVGWSSYDIEKTVKNVMISLIPTFFVDSVHEDLPVEEKSIIEEMIAKIDHYVEEHTLKGDFQATVEVKQSKDMQVFVLHEPGTSDSIEFHLLINKLKANSIHFHIEYERSRVDDQGASGGFYEVIIFIQNTLASGIVYDLLKKIPSLIPLNVKKDRIDLITEKAAYRLNTQPENLLLSKIEEESNTGNLKIVFNFNRSVNTFKFDNENNIIYFTRE